MRKNILCFGDSNCYGYNPIDNTRYDYDTRWTGRLQNLLGSDYYVIEEGCNGRTTLLNDDAFPYKNTREYILPCLKSHTPLDLMLICLGTNDLKPKFAVRPIDIAEMMEELIRIIRTFNYGSFGSVPKIMLMTPIAMKNASENLASDFDENSIKKSRELGKYYSELAKKIDCYYFDLNEFVDAPSPIDCVHLTTDGHRIVAENLFKKIKSII